jgi:predicted phosphohydrolase
VGWSRWKSKTKVKTEVDVLMNADLWKVHNLKEVGNDLDLPSQLPGMRAFLKSANLERSQFVERNSRHGDCVLNEMRC